MSGTGEHLDAGRPWPVHAVLLAAGESTRMGDLKALLAWEGQPLLSYQVQQLLACPIERLVVVLGHRAGELRGLLPPDERVRVVLNPQYRSGKVSSILAGLAETEAQRHLLILGVDQPRPAWLIEMTLRAHVRAPARITVAGYGGRRGHPVVFNPSLRADLLGIAEATEGLRAVLQRHRDAVQVCETGAPLALANLNTPQDYESARLISSTSSARAGNQ